jgi:hypothetical protein
MGSIKSNLSFFILKVPSRLFRINLYRVIILLKLILTMTTPG